MFPPTETFQKFSQSDQSIGGDRDNNNSRKTGGFNDSLGEQNKTRSMYIVDPDDISLI